MNKKMNNIFLLTIDVDWAPDFAIERITNYLTEKKIKCTWFITHNSKAIRKLFLHPELFEIGIHPNFLENSTQGNNEREIVSNLLKIAPNAISFRTHALYQSTYILKMLREDFNLKNDASLFLPETPNLTPHKIYFSAKNKPLIRFPFFWEDDIHTYSPNPDFSFDKKKYSFPGLKIFNFHPFFIVLNIKDMDTCNKIKKEKNRTNLSPKEIEIYINKEKGIQNFFKDFIKFLSKNKTYTISELSEMHENGNL